jgi:hypothetical protein
VSEPTGYEKDKCQINLPGCEKNHAGYLRRKQFSRVGPWLDSCETCARKEYEPPPQFQEEKNEKQS